MTENVVRRSVLRVDAGKRENEHRDLTGTIPTPCAVKSNPARLGVGDGRDHLSALRWKSS